MPVFSWGWIGLLVLALPWAQSPSSLIQMIHTESPPTLVLYRQGLGAELRRNLRYIKKTPTFLTLSHWWWLFLKASCVTPHFQKLRPQSRMWHPRVYDCKKLIHSWPAKLPGTCWNCILWGVLAVALAKSSVMVSLAARSLLNYAICFFDYELVGSFGDCSDECACSEVWWIPPELPLLVKVRRKDDSKVYWK